MHHTGFYSVLITGGSDLNRTILATSGHVFLFHIRHALSGYFFLLILLLAGFIIIGIHFFFSFNRTPRHEWVVLTAAAWTRRYGCTVSLLKYSWLQYIIAFLLSCLLLAVFEYKGQILSRILTAIGRYYDPFTGMLSSLWMSIILCTATAILFLAFLCVTHFSRISRFCMSDIRNCHIFWFAYADTIRAFIIAIPVIFILDICAVEPGAVQSVLFTICNQFAAVARFCVDRIYQIILIMVLIIIIRWINNRRFVTKITDFSVIKDGKNEAVTGLDDAIKNEIGRLKRMYLDPGAFRDIESIARGDFRMFRMTDDPLREDIATISDSLKIGSVFEVPVKVATNLVSLFICAPRISGLLDMDKGDFWQVYASYQDGWKSFTWRVTPEDLKSMKDSPDTDESDFILSDNHPEKMVILDSGKQPQSREANIQYQLKVTVKNKDKPDPSPKPEETGIDQEHIAEILTAKILVNLSNPGTPRWEAFVYYNRGLKAYRQALREKNNKERKEEDLADAFFFFCQAVLYDESYALAYHGLALVLAEKDCKEYYIWISFFLQKSLACDARFWRAKYAKMIVDIKYALKSGQIKTNDSPVPITGISYSINLRSDKKAGFNFIPNSNNHKNSPPWDSLLKTCIELIREAPGYPAFFSWKGIIEWQMGDHSKLQEYKSCIASFKTAIYLYEDELIRLGFSDDLYLNYEEKKLLVRSCIQNNHLMVCICEAVNMKDTPEIHDIMAVIKESDDYIAARSLNPELSDTYLENMAENIIKNFFSPR
jgi:hypothetical protein